MQKRRLLSLILAIAMITTAFAGVMVVSAEQAVNSTEEAEMVIDSQTEDVAAAAGEIVADFTQMSAVPVYSSSNGQGFVETSDAIMPEGYERQVAPTSRITVSSEGAKVTESDGTYLHNKTNSDDGDDFNYGGLIYRIDTAAGAYHLEVEVTGTSTDTRVAPTGMDASGLTKTGNWDNCNHVPRTVSAVWEGSKWSYDFATGENFVEIEIEPATLPTADNPQTVGVKSIKITPLDPNPAGDKPTIHILGDSTQKAYSFNETISSWGQTLVNYFDPAKVNVVNYSMGGRAMKSNYNEGRANELLIRGKQGDFVFIHSAHNDETVSTNRFSRGAGVKDDAAANNENYNKWLDMYVSAIKARGMTPVLVTAMPRVNGSTGVPNSGFNPDAPANMKAKAKSDSEVAVADLYEGAKAYISKLSGKEVAYIYNNTEAGETPAGNAANGANGDGTHYREAASKQWCRIILQSIYDQSVASTDTYTDKAICKELVDLMPSSVVNAASTGDWSAVFPEMASDVSAVDVVPGAAKQAESNFYYRNNIEKALQLGLLHKDSNNLFKPTQTVTVGEYARGIEKAFGLAENSLTNYTRTYEQLKADNVIEVLAAADEEAVEETVASEDIPVQAEDGSYTVTVTKPVGGEVTIYNESALKSATADITANVTANTVIADNEYFTFTAPSEIVKKTRSTSFTNKEISNNAIEVRNNGTKQPEYAAKADGVLSLYLYFVGHKLITCENKTDNKMVQKYIDDTEIAGSSENTFGVVTFNVEAGKTYQVYTNGGTGQLFGIKYESTDYPQSTESLVVNANDEVRVKAVADNGYVNNAILVNGEEKTKAREYTFEVTGDTTVAASFKAEPDFVDGAIASDAALTREAMGAVLYDAYQEFQKNGADDAKKNMQTYMSNNGGIPSPDDPNYDPNIKYEGTPYIPLTGWGALTDTNELSDSLYVKVKTAYNLGLMRTEKGIARASIANGTELEPKAQVTRAKAAKSLVFAFILTQLPSEESQVLPDGINHASETADIAVANASAPSVPLTSTVNYDYEITKAEFDASGNLSVDLSYNGTEENPTAKLLIGVYDKNDSKIMTNSAVFDVEGTTVKDLFFVKPDNGETVKLYIWDGTDGIKPLSEVKTASNNAANPSTPPPSPSPTNEPTSPPVKKVTVVQASSQETFEYDTIREAVAKAKELNPQSEADRVTINVDPADYEEQVVFDNVKYITLQQTPNTNGVVDLHWYYCTGYSAANCDLSGSYNPDIDWYTNPPQDTSGKTYKIGELISAGTTLTYTDLKGESHTYTIGSRDQCLGNTGGLDKMATLIIRNNAENITVKDLNIVNSVPVFATQGEKDAHLTPNEDYPDLPDRSMLANCTEYTAEEKIDSMGEVTKAKYEAYAASNTLTAGQSAWLARSGAFNERGHAVSFYSGDKIIFENIRLRGNQDSLYAAGGRAYFKNCDIIGGTDYIYGGATAVFDNCKLGLEGFSDKTYGSPIATGGHDVMRKYGYLFYNCTLYNMRDNNGTNNFGGPWQAGSQVTYFNCIIDDNASVGKSKFVLDEMGWRRFGAENGLSRSYEYGTKNISGTAVDFSKRVVNKSVEEGGPGMGTVLNEWQILEFNPRNYFSKECDSKYTDDWDPMNFADTYLSKVDAAIAAATVTIPSNEETTFALQQAPEGVTFKWESASTNAVVLEDGKNITVIRPAAGEENIETKVILYAMDNENKFGDKKEIPVIITPTTNTTDVFSIPVTITESTSLSEDTEYYITISKNGAVIKKQTVTIPAGSTTAAATIENIPSNETGIEYDVKIVSQSDEMAIVTPADGITKVNGITGQSVALNITAQKAIDEKIDVDITTSAADGNKTYDLIALAKANGANDSVATSDIISVEFDLDLTMAPGSASYIDISSGTPSNANGATPQRFTAIKINNSWTQLDSVDNSQGWSGSSNGPGQCLNITGKFDYKTTHHVKATIDYKAGTVTIDGSDSGSGKTATPYTFEHFPENVEKGKLNMGVFVGSNSDKYTISNVTVTYKKVRTSSDPNSYTVSVAEPDNNADVKIMNGENAVDTMTADIDSTITVRVDVNTDEDVSISTNPVAAVTRDETKSDAQYNYYTFAMPSNNTTIKVKRTEYVEPEPPYGKVVDNDDGSKTLYFGTESITQSNSQAKIVSDTVNNVELVRPDYFYPGSNGYGELTMSEINLKDSGYDKVEFVLANQSTSNVVIKVGGTQVASFTDVTTGGWSPYKTFAADLSTTDAEGNVTIESTITSGNFCGNFAWVRFYKSN